MANDSAKNPENTNVSRDYPKMRFINVDEFIHKRMNFYHERKKIFHMWIKNEHTYKRVEKEKSNRFLKRMNKRIRLLIFVNAKKACLKQTNEQRI